MTMWRSTLTFTPGALGLLLLLPPLAAVAQPTAAQPSQAASLSADPGDRAVANVVAFARLYGYVRFFHPSEQAARTNWDSVAVAGMRTVENAPTADSLARALSGIIGPIAPEVQIFPAASPAPARVSALPDGDSAPLGVLHWRHEGVRTWPAEADWQEEAYRSGIAVVPAPGGRVPEGIPDPRRPLRADLGGGVAAWIPLSKFVVHASDSATFQPVTVAYDSTFSATERSVRLASVAIVWNVIQHFYPYFDVVQSDWKAALEWAVRRGWRDEGPLEFEQTLRGLLAAAHDGHGWADLMPYRQFAGVPLRAAWIEDRLVVIAVDDSVADRVRPGDVITSIGGEPAAAAFERLRPFLPGATPQWSRFSGLGLLLGGAPGSTLTLALQHGADSGAAARELSFVRNRRGFPLERRPAPVDSVGRGLAYVDLSRATDSVFSAALPQLVAARGIILDLRGYPRLDTFAVLAHLADSVLKPPMDVRDGAGHQPPRGGTPLVLHPDRAGMTFRPRDPSTYTIAPATPRLTSNVVFLTNERAISYSETTLSLVEGFALGEIAGSPTAGTNGTNNPFMVPGGYRVTWTGGRFLKPDGSLLHGVGIVPGIPVAPTIRGVVAGRDEVLERAIVLLEQRVNRDGR
jgi:C-terminal processing protease CtpA/Prc